VKPRPRRSTVSSSAVGAAAFVAGFSTMGAEMAAPRLLAPYVGTTQLVWTSVIGVLLAALAAGGFIGGRLADRWPQRRHLGRVLMGAGAWLAAIPLAARPLLQWGSDSLIRAEIGPFLISLAAVSLLFAPPVLLAGMIGPWAVRLAGAGRQDLGRVAGVLSGIATLGSIAGTFGTTLLGLPLLGTRRTLVVLAAALVAAGAVVARLGWRDAASAGLLLLFLGWQASGPIAARSDTLYESESLYHYARIDGALRGPRMLVVNEGAAAQSITLPPEGRAGGVWGVLASAAQLTGAEQELRVLVVGLAGGTVAAQIAHDLDGKRTVQIDGIEIDAAIVEASRRHLALDEIPGLEVHVADGRVAVRRSDETYDLIVVDAFRGSYVPAHLATVEFFEECRARLSSEGVVALNVAVGRSGSALLDALAATLRRAFPAVGKLDVPPSLSPIVNTVLVASPSAFRVASDAPAVQSLPAAEDDSALALSDDRAPVELLTDASLLGVLGLQ